MELTALRHPFSPLLILALSLAPAVLAADPPPQAVADPGVRAKNEIRESLIHIKAGELDQALTQVQAVENSPNVPPNIRSTAIEVEAQIFIKKKDMAGALAARKRQVELLDDKHKYHAIKGVDEVDVTLKHDVEAGVELPEPVLKAYLNWATLAHQNGDRDTALKAYRVALAYGYGDDKPETGLKQLQGMPVDSMRASGGGARKGLTLLGFHITLVAGVLMVTDPLTYTNAASVNTDYPLTTMLLGGGIHGEHALGPRFVLGLTAMVLFGSPTPDKKAADAVDYHPTGSVLGGLVEPELEYRLAGRSLSLGINVPLMIRDVTLSAPTESGQAVFVTLPELFTFGAGLSINWTPGRFFVSQRAQFSPSYGLAFGGLLGFAL
ncbi:MAG TPA: hypothetical protein VL588_11605 [Bdellovibrionota bacterium]|nr:hypothetical protein [Bdellovibrionota bacterium]